MKTSIISPSSRVFVCTDGYIQRKNFNRAMGRIVFGSKHFPILKYNCIPKAQSKEFDTADCHNEPNAIDGCAVSGRV